MINAARLEHGAPPLRRKRSDLTTRRRPPWPAPWQNGRECNTVYDRQVERGGNR